jgi:hypothetical protein
MKPFKWLSSWFSKQKTAIVYALDSNVMAEQTFQNRVRAWMLECFGVRVAADKIERNHRFLEEALELVQACGCTRHEAMQLVEYVFSRPLGEPIQEVGGVSVTLAALCSAHKIGLQAAGEEELSRINDPHVMQRIREKQAKKPRYSPLPAPMYRHGPRY